MEVISRSRSRAIRVSDCSTTSRRQLHPHSFPGWSVESLDIHADLTPHLFRPLVIGASPSLVDLTLRSGIVSTNWKKFLRAARFPHLETITLSGDVPLLDLIRFLNRHRTISEVYIVPSRGFVREPFPAPRRNLTMPNLEVLSAPLPWVLAILGSVAVAPSLFQLRISDGCARRNSSTLSAIFDCLMMCKRVEELEISLPLRTPYAILRPNDSFDYDRFPHLGTKVFGILLTEFPTVFRPSPDDADIIVSS
jgi:hypothetical protein